MGAAFWIRRFILVWTAAFVLIAGAQALKGRATSPTQRSAALVAATATGQIDLRATA